MAEQETTTTDRLTTPFFGTQETKPTDYYDTFCLHCHAHTTSAKELSECPTCHSTELLTEGRSNA